MLEESDELPEGTRWGSKVARVFDLDARWKVSDPCLIMVIDASSAQAVAFRGWCEACSSTRLVICSLCVRPAVHLVIGHGGSNLASAADCDRAVRSKV